MTNKKKTTGKTETAGKTAKKDRVILALSTEQAERILRWMDGKILSSDNFMVSIAHRIENTLEKQKAKREEEPESVLITAEESRIKSEMEMPDDVMEAITQASQEAIFISDEDRAMQVNTEIRPEPGIISDRR